MATKKQIEANRLNARKSTGPRTTAGKARSSMNALRTGIDAKSQVIYGEWLGDFRSLQTEYYDRFHPTTPEQRMLVDTLVDSEWLLRRFRNCETQLWGESTHVIHQFTLGETYRQIADHLARLQRRIDSAQRNFRNALRELERLQAEEAALANVEEETENPEIGFVPHVHPAPASHPSEPSPQQPLDAPTNPLTQSTS